DAHKALRQGLVDRLATPDELREHAANLALNPPPPRRATLFQRLLALAPLRPLIARQLRRQVAHRVREDHYPAPYAIIRLWKETAGQPRPENFEAEAHSIARLMCGDTARSLVRVFFLQNRLKGLGRKADFKLRRMHVIGAGTMGGDIAAWCAARGIEVSVQDEQKEYAEKALARAREYFSHKLKDARKAQGAAERLKVDMGGDSVSDSDLVIEAIIEDREAKIAVLREVEPRLAEDAILATNTSSIPLEALAQALEKPARLFGLHFFNPVTKMPLVEVISTPANSEAELERALAAVRAMGKLPVPVKSAPGFLVNRILAPYMMAALEAHDEGVALEALDRAAEDFGMPMGPAELADTVGLDILVAVAGILKDTIGVDMPRSIRELVDAGHRGRKSGRGLYRWRKGKPVKDTRRAGNGDSQLQDRLILPFLNEAVHCLREGVVADADLLDAGAIFGTGFAPFRGGPMHYARHRGATAIKARLGELAQQYGELYRPDAGWDTL
ncbi:MAG: 3-hydroxyacyl-CoA dehydrogenase family protein, partial [Gammaproteobacteria bacterium]